MHPTVHGWRPASRLHQCWCRPPLPPTPRQALVASSVVSQENRQHIHVHYLQHPSTKASQLRRIPPPSESPALSGSTLRYRMQYFSSVSLVHGTMKVIHAAGERGRQQQQTAGGRRSAGAGRGRGDYAVKFRGFSRFTRPHLFSFLGMVRTLNVAPRNVIHFPTTLLSR